MRALFTAIALLTFNAWSMAAEITNYSASTRGPNLDVDYEFKLDRAEVNTLASSETRATLLAFFTATLGPLGPVAARYVSEKADEVRAKSGKSGAWVKMTIRNGNSLHVWDCGPIGSSEPVETPRPDPREREDLPPPPPPFTGMKISVANMCGEDIRIAVRYKNMEEDWIIRGWYAVRPLLTSAGDIMYRVKTVTNSRYPTYLGKDFEFEGETYKFEIANDFEVGGGSVHVKACSRRLYDGNW
jgi:hypothetical protein